MTYPMKRVIVVLSLAFALLGANQASAQKFFTREGKISFFSETPVENIEAHNQKATSVLETSTGQMEFAVLVKGFQFEKALMQEHFNENYLESTKFPKAIFKGTIQEIAKVDFEKDGTYPVVVKGDMTIHGVTKPVTANGQITVKNGAISANSTFNLAPEDFDIKIPAVVRDNIAKSVKVVVKADFQPYTSSGS